MKFSSVATILAAVMLALSATGAARAGPTLISEGFDNVGTLAAGGWVVENRSASPVDNWFQGNAGVLPAQAGAADAYIAANFLLAGSGPLSLWLITPQFDRSQAGTLTFYTRTDALNGFSADRLDVRLSTGGTASADFTSLLFSVNATGVVDGFPDDWMLVTVNYAAGALGDTGRLALVYDVANVNDANYIGIDTLAVTVTGAAATVPEPMTLALSAAALAAMALARRRRGCRSLA